MITMTKLAELAGVSQPTVSRVLNGNTSVNPEVAKKVLDCAKKYNYQPNMIARSLSGSKTHLIAVVVPDIANPFFADLIKSIENESMKAGYSILIFNSDYDRGKERKYLEILQQYRVDALLLAPVCADEDSIAPFRQLSVPWMIITNFARDVDCIYISHEKAGAMVAEHLVDTGNKTFAFIGRSDDEKLVGFRHELRVRGIDIEQNLLIFSEKDEEENLRSLLAYLRKNGEKTGVFAHNDMEALVVMNGLAMAGISIPDRAALVGFDDTFVSRRVHPGITSVSQPVEKMGRMAVRNLLESMENGEQRSGIHVELDAQLIVRGSSHPDKSWGCRSDKCQEEEE